MRVETQTKRLARIIFLFSASSFCAIFACLVVTHGTKAPAQQTVNFLPVYTYQNPFRVPGSASSDAVPETKAANVPTRLFSVKCLSGLSALGALWLASTWYLQGGRNTKTRRNRQVRSLTSPEMNPLAILPVIRVQNQDTFCPSVLCRPTTSGPLAHRKTTAPCQSRFRPIILAASQTRFERLQ